MDKKPWRYSKLRTMDISNGPGVRISLFTQGCIHKCDECFNKETWSFDNGKEWTYELDVKILKLLSKNYIEGISILGGDPFVYYEDKYYNEYTENDECDDCLLQLLGKVKFVYPEKNVWLWTGYSWSDFFKNDNFSKRVQRVLPFIDVLVDGKFIKKEYDSKLKYCGSKNQRVIDVKKSLEKNKMILL